MRAVVLIKQVPDVRAGSVGLREDGTIDRAAAPAITNPADLHALEAGLQVADDVCVLSMGPPHAEESLREAVALGAGKAILLCDRAFAGSDTWATANALATAIRAVGEFDLVLCGISALDGETGQVGPQVAARLGIPQATGCEAIEKAGDSLVVRRIVEGGYETLCVPRPALVTVAETGFEPRYATFPGRRHAATCEITRLTAADLGLDADAVGLDASPTKVAHMSPVPVARAACRTVGVDLSYEDLAAELRAARPHDGREHRAPCGEGGEVREEHARPVARDGEASVWVVCELDGDELGQASIELLSKAAELATRLDAGVGAVCIGAGVEAARHEAARFGADVVLCATDPELGPYRCEPHAHVLADAIRVHGPDIVLFSATTTGRDLAPRVAADLGTGLAADCIDLHVADWQRRGTTYGNLLHQERPAMSGAVLATCVCPEARPQMATVRPGVFEPVERPRDAARIDLPVTLTPEDLRVEVLDRSVQHVEVALAEADVIVAGGAGCDAASWHLIEDLADAIGGNVAASRGAVEAGLAPRALQVGQTGSTVAPSLYVACGISGALQHVVGMRRAGTVLAVNRDPDAPIFGFADFGIVDDVRSALPALTMALAAARDT